MSSGKQPPAEKRSLVQRGLDAIFGYDFFISYTRQDGGKEYAEGLARRLKAAGFQIFFDSDEYAMGDDWKVEGKWALKRTSQLILVASPEALSSAAVVREVEVYSSLPKRRIIPIDFDGTIRNRDESKPIFKYLKSEILFIEEDPGCLGADPSDFIVQKLQEGFNLKRQDKKRSRVFAGAAALLAMLTILVAAAGIIALQQKNIAIEQRDESEARRLAAVSEVNAANQTDLAHLLALESLRVSETREGWAALFESLSHPVMARTPLTPVTGAASPVHRVAFSPIDSMVAASAIGRVFLWHAESREMSELGVHEGDPGVKGLAFSADGKLLASGDSDGNVLLWDVVKREQTGKLVTMHDDDVWDLAFSPDGRWLASASFDGYVRLWGVQSQEMKWKQRGNPSTDDKKKVLAVAFDPVGLRLASASADGTVRLWDPESGKMIAEPLTGQAGWKRGMAFSPDLSLFAVATEDNSIRLWDLKTRKVIKQLIGHDDEVRALAFSPVKDDPRLVSASHDRTVRLWNTASGKSIGRPMNGHDRSVYGVAFDRGGSLLASGSFDATVRLWDLDAGPQVGRPLAGHNELKAMALSADGSLAASAGQDGTVRLWDVAVGVQKPSYLKGHGKVGSLAFSPDASLLATGGVKGTTLLWSVAADELAVPPLPGHSELTRLAFNAKGSRLATADFKLEPPSGFKATLRIWNTISGKRLGMPMTAHKGKVLGLAFSSDGKFLASAALDKTVTLWRVESGLELMKTFRHDTIVWAVAFGAEDARLVSVGKDGIRVWNVAEGGQEGKTRQPSREEWVHAALSHDAALLATATEDGTLRLWDVASGQLVGEPLRGHQPRVVGVAFSLDKMLIASAGSDKDDAIRLWPAQTRWPILACNAAGRNLTLAEWQSLVDDASETYRSQCPQYDPGIGAPTVTEYGTRALDLKMGWPARRKD